MDPIIRFGVMSDHRLVVDAQQNIVGVYVAMPTPRDVGEHVALKLELPWGEGMDLQGHVEWVARPAPAALHQRPGYGVICELQPWQAQLLTRLKLHAPPMMVPRSPPSA